MPFTGGMRTALVLLATLLVAACAAEPGESSSSTDVDVVEILDTELPQAAEPSLPLVPERCGAVFTPDAELLEETTTAAARWAAATGCDVRVGEGGILVQLVDVILDLEGNPTSRKGVTRASDDMSVIILMVTPDRDARALPHELGHALYPVEREQYPRGHVHTEDGQACEALMCSDGGLGFITAADLVAVCEGFPCATMTPER